MNQTYRGKVAQETLRRFPNLPLNTLAGFLVKYYSGVFSTKEDARSVLRYYAGSKGEKNRVSAKNSKALVEIKDRGIPESDTEVLIDYHLKPGFWLILNDLHIPYHSKEAILAALIYAKKYKLQGLFLNGDIQDCEAVGFWRPTRKRDFVREVIIMTDFLDWLRAMFPKCEIVWKRGNHEERLMNYYRSNAPDLADLPTTGLETILDLDSRKIEYLDGKNIVRAGKLPIVHGHELRGGYSPISPAKWIFTKWGGPIACAHFHKSTTYDETNGEGVLITSWSIGCACNLHPDYNPFANKWTHGFALVEILEDGSYSFKNKKIHDGEIVR
jgi:hypothetical protein